LNHARVRRGGGRPLCVAQNQTDGPFPSRYAPKCSMMRFEAC